MSRRAELPALLVTVGQQIDTEDFETTLTSLDLKQQFLTFIVNGYDVNMMDMILIVVDVVDGFAQVQHG